MKKKPAHPKVVVAEEFRLVGKDGTIRAVLELDGKEDPHLCLLDKKGKLRASLALHDGESFLELLDKNEKVRASIGLGKTGQPSLVLHNKKEQDRLVLELGDKAGPGMDLYDKKGELRASFSLYNEDTLPKLALIDKDGRRRVVRRVDDETPLLVLYDKEGEACAMLDPEGDEYPA